MLDIRAVLAILGCVKTLSLPILSGPRANAATNYSTSGHPFEAMPRYEVFHLVLMVTHGCNLRCRYCYTGRKFRRSMRPQVGRAAIDCAIRSIQPGGILELGFFGGEPLLVPELVEELLEYATQAADASALELRVGLTTNGTATTKAAWRVMLRPEVHLAVSHDGLPQIHDRHRRRRDGSATSFQVSETLRTLIEAGRAVRAVMVVRPDSCAVLPEGIRGLRKRGVRSIDLALDVWAAWGPGDIGTLEQTLVRAAQLWQAGLPEHRISWFDEKAAQLAGLEGRPSARCGFGHGEVAVAPSGNLYPCERIVGEDYPGHPFRLAPHVLECEDFRRPPRAPPLPVACRNCAIQPHCNTACRCNNLIRTGDATRPDTLLCTRERVLYQQTARVLGLPVHA